MRVSEFYNLNRTQATLDFVDVDIENDTAVYIDPGAIRVLPDDWAKQSLEMISTFFHSVVDALQQGDQARVRELLIRLQEPNETHFGLSKGKSRGRGLGPFLVGKICNNLTMSKAARTGILEDLEDTALFVDKIGKDIVSDITTNVIRGMLISYTQSVCKMYGIPLEEGIYSGLAWDPQRREWCEEYTKLPVAKEKPLLLVPKAIVRYDLYLTKAEYFRKYLAPSLRDEELDNPASKLVKVAKDGHRSVNIEDIIAEYDKGKDSVADLTLKRVELFHSYKDDKRKNPSPLLTHDELSDVTGSPRVDYDTLLNAVLRIPAGQSGAQAYHRAVEQLLTALLYPALTHCIIESELDQGRKRVDISYTNVAQRGFFDWLTRQQVPCSYIFVECKNYGSEVGNPELDQLCGRFSPLRGKVGLLVCRSFDDKDRFIERCRDAALAQRGIVLPLDDDDLSALVDEVKKSLLPPADVTEMVFADRPDPQEFKVLHQRYRQLVS